VSGAAASARFAPGIDDATPRRIVAVGGGGFLMDDATLAQERWLLTLCARAAPPRVVFVGTASGDAERAQLKFMKVFSALGALPSTLGFFPYEMRRDYAAAVSEADLVYVGGGNTPAMLAVWRSFGFDRALRAAYERGTVLAGISAGANCWFDGYVTDSIPGGGVRTDGLGWLDGVFCPHLDSEAWRQPMLAATIGVAVGAGEHVAVLYENEARVRAVCSGEPAKAVCIARDGGDEPLAAVALEDIRPIPIAPAATTP
jgi:dipeptidase E